MWPVGLLDAALIALLLILNLPFYAGGRGEHLSWRMEHGRIRIERRSEPSNPTGFWVDGNTEGLRFAPEASFHGRGDWMVNVPLWMPLLGCLGLAAGARALTRRSERD